MNPQKPPTRAVFDYLLGRLILDGKNGTMGVLI